MSKMPWPPSRLVCVIIYKRRLSPRGFRRCWGWPEEWNFCLWARISRPWLVLTREDNRSENAQKICEEIRKGIARKTDGRDLFIIPDRRQAIAFALKSGKNGDLVVITGKGHEQSLNVDGRELMWDDRRVVAEELAKI